MAMRTPNSVFCVFSLLFCVLSFCGVSEASLSQVKEADLPTTPATLPPGLKERGFTVAKVLHILSWHEAHHQGQAHITLNLFKAAEAAG